MVHCLLWSARTASETVHSTVQSNGVVHCLLQSAQTASETVHSTVQSNGVVHCLLRSAQTASETVQSTVQSNGVMHCLLRSAETVSETVHSTIIKTRRIKFTHSLYRRNILSVNLWQFYLFNIFIELERAKKSEEYESINEYHPARDRVGRVTDCEVRGLCFKSPGLILTTKTDTSFLSRVVMDGGGPCSVPLSGWKSLLRWSLLLGRWRATTLQKTTLKTKKKHEWRYIIIVHNNRKK